MEVDKELMQELRFAYGHTIVELPLIIILALGLSKFSSLDLTSNEDLKIIGLIGGASITLFSLLQVRRLMKRKIVGAVDTISNKNYFFKINSKRSGPIILGIVFSALNPFFLIWWSTVGLKLITDSISLFGVVLGILFTFFFHIWMDYVWLTVTSYMISKKYTDIESEVLYCLTFGTNYCTCFIGLYLVTVNIVLNILVL
jgi:threonine/homoserine/homoserine lactone efflux protein